MTWEKGKLFVIEGMDGAGKRTQAQLLEERLKADGVDALLVSFPNYRSDSSNLVVKYLRGEFENTQTFVNKTTFAKQISSFYAVDRVATFLSPTFNGKSLLQLLQEGLTIICDRYTTSNILHQSANVDETDIDGYIEWVLELEHKHFNLPKPDSVIFLDVPAHISIQNIKKRYKGEPKEDLLEHISHLERVEELKKRIVSKCGWTPIISTSDGVMLSVEEIHEQIYTIVRNKLD